MNDRRKALIALVAAALCWSIGGVLIKWVPWHPMAILSVRSGIAAVFLWVLARKPRFTWSAAQIGSAVAYAATIWLYVPSVKLTTAANAILLQYTAPVWVALLAAWALKERPSRIDWLSLLVVLGGMTLFFKDGLSSTSLVGDLMALGSGVTMAIMMVLLRKQKAARPLDSVVLGNILAFLGGLPFCFGRAGPPAAGWLVLVLMGILQLGTAYALYTYGIQRVTALEGAIVVTLEPILNPIWVALLLGERPSGWALVGGLLVLGAVTARGIVMALQNGQQARARARAAGSAL